MNIDIYKRIIRHIFIVLLSYFIVPSSPLLLRIMTIDGLINAISFLWDNLTDSEKKHISEIATQNASEISDQKNVNDLIIMDYDPNKINDNKKQLIDVVKITSIYEMSLFERYVLYASTFIGYNILCTSLWINNINVIYYLLSLVSIPEISNLISQSDVWQIVRKKKRIFNKKSNFKKYCNDYKRVIKHIFGKERCKYRI